MKNKSFFTDKSPFIKILGEKNNVIFTRPRRFGKSLVLQMLRDYFDKNKRDQFDTVFGSLWIGEKDSGGNYLQETEDQGKYIILHIDFGSVGGLTSVSPDPLAPTKEFHEVVLGSVDLCVKRYNLTLSDTPTTAHRAIQLLRNAAPEGTPIFVFVDEYDTPFNSLILRSPITPADKKTALDPLKLAYSSFLQALKAANTCNYMTGVLNVHIPEFSGFTPNRVSFDPDWHAFAGYTEDDVKHLLTQVKSLLLPDDPRLKLFQEESALPLLTKAYNGYWFAITDLKQPKMYNADVVNNFVRFTLSEYRHPVGDELSFAATTLSDNVLAFAASLPHHRYLLLDPMMDDFPSPVLISKAVDMDQILDIYDPMHQTKGMFWQILYDFGALTTKRVGADGSNLLIGAPNEVARDEYLTAIADVIDPQIRMNGIAKGAFLAMLESGNPTDFIRCYNDGFISIPNFERGGTDVKEPEGAFQVLLIACLLLFQKEGAFISTSVVSSLTKETLENTPISLWNQGTRNSRRPSLSSRLST